jgi:hypothetical protein
MTFFSAGMLLIRCMTIVVLGLIGGSWVALYIGADLCLYLVVKTLRGDFWYWVPAGFKTEILISTFTRVLVKMVTDFTSIAQFRHPNEVGGIYWVLEVLLTMGSLPVAFTFTEYLDHTNFDRAVLQSMMLYIIPCTLFCFVIFFFYIDRKYLSTFFSMQRGTDYTVKYFREGKDDLTKAKLTLERSKYQWISIENEVKTWVEENWERWEEEKPSWFDEGMRAKIPMEYIPTTGDARRRESLRRASVDVDAEGGLGGALRASIRRASIGGAIEGHVKVVPIEGDN